MKYYVVYEGWNRWVLHEVTDGGIDYFVTAGESFEELMRLAYQNRGVRFKIVLEVA